MSARGEIVNLVVSVVVLLSLSVTVHAEETTQIPLDEIWAYDMPGTRNIGGLDAVKEPTGVTVQPMVNQIVTFLASRHPKEGENVGPAFIVRGTRRKALDNAKTVLTGTVKPESIFPPDTDLTLFFYSAIGGGYVRIASVEKSDHTITVKYRFVLHNTRDDSLHFALIPLGQLLEDKYEVKIEQIGSVDFKGRPAAPIARFERVVCQGTSFSIRKQKP
jgi:hypothetical protein